MRAGHACRRVAEVRPALRDELTALTAKLAWLDRSGGSLDSPIRGKLYGIDTPNLSGRYCSRYDAVDKQPVTN